MEGTAEGVQAGAGEGMAAAEAATEAVVVGAVAAEAVVGIAVIGAAIVATGAIAGKWTSLKSSAFFSCSAANTSSLA